MFIVRGGKVAMATSGSTSGVGAAGPDAGLFDFQLEEADVLGVEGVKGVDFCRSEGEGGPHTMYFEKVREGSSSRPASSSLRHYPPNPARLAYRMVRSY